MHDVASGAPRQQAAYFLPFGSPLNALATILVACSAVSNLVGAARLSEGLMLPVICAAALASDGLKAALPVVIRARWRAEPVTAGLLGVLAAACFAFSLSMALGSACGTRADATANRRQAAATFAAARQAVDGAEAEIAKIGAQRSAAEIEAAQVAGEGVAAKVWVGTAHCIDITRTASQQACAMWLDLAKEKALSLRLAELRAALPSLQAKLDGLRPVAGDGADPQVNALQNVAGLFGLALPADKLALGLSVLLVAILELGATLAPLAAAGGPAPDAQTAAGGRLLPADGAPAQPLPTVIALAHAQNRSLAHAGLRELADALARIGGTFEGSQSALAQALGTNRTGVARLLANASAAGVVRVHAIKGHGTRVALVQNLRPVAALQR